MATIMRKMNVISRCEALYRSRESSEQLPGLYHSYVLAICRNPGMTQDALAHTLCISKSSVARHLAVLEKDGYITRTPGEEDRRELLVFPTQKMQDIHPDVVAITKRWNALLAESFTEEELLLFHNMLDKMFDKSMEIVYAGGGSD
ncbi:MAG: MarR family transcriptional regulator [Clostridia bacterium]|nr:MarR family transcriptional regulator [Clostridia bacterium]